MGAYVQTVTGPVAPNALGLTLLHEHLLCDLSLPERRASTPDLAIPLSERFAIDYRPMDHPGNHRLDDRALMTAELEVFRAAGGGTVVELTTGGIGPDPEGLAAISRASGVHVVLGAGHYVIDYATPDVVAMSVEALTDEMLGQLREGAWGTDVRCGLIGEIGCSWPLHPFERRCLEAAARSQAATGAAINVHPGRHPDAPHEILDVLERAGADLTRVVISHMDRTYPDGEGIVALARRGCVVEWDFFGIEHSNYWMAPIDLPNDWMRIRQIARLFEAGLGERVAISHDICTRSRLKANGGHGYAHIPRNVTQLMRDRGFGDAELRLMLVETPRRLLTLPA